MLTSFSSVVLQIKISSVYLNIYAYFLLKYIIIIKTFSYLAICLPTKNPSGKTILFAL